jgi:hypothetical protein
MSNPLKSLILGQAHPKEMVKPIMFNGYYKYTRAIFFTGKDGKVIANKTDSLSMYANI